VGGARIKLADLETMYTTTQHANLRLARDWLNPWLLYAEERYDEALAELAEAIDRVHASNSVAQRVRLLALQAVALDATGKRESARSALREGVELGAPGGYIRRWLDAGPSIAPLLHDVREAGDIPRALHPYLDSLLDACRSAFGDAAFQPAHPLVRPLAGEMLEPLTARELEIVRLICRGHSGPEIARELVLAYNTVRKHISNIYSKLGVGSRSQAIARVHELNLL
jgi:LuxR family maltose regulon positive regulatory protein